jgi:5-methylcytosine-specific restriction endonuclease McrA
MKAPSATPTPADAAIRRRCRHALASHRRRAARDFQRLDYTLADLERLAAASPCCCYCGTPLPAGGFAFDHKTPTARAADHVLGNLAVCCIPCNTAKGLLTAEEFLQLLALLRTWHPRAGSDLLARLRAGGRRYAQGR